MKPCECTNDNYFCHPAEGCICKHGFNGINCKESTILGQVYPPIDQDGGYGVIVAIIMVSIIFIAVVVLLVFYYRRRVANLKTEIAHVQYIADPTGYSPDRNHFDNPVYSFQGDGKRDNEQLLNNSTKIHNNFHKPSNTNLERARLVRYGMISAVDKSTTEFCESVECAFTTLWLTDEGSLVSLVTGFACGDNRFDFIAFVIVVTGLL
ncbi:hypothetical protein NQ318_007714 [Aromia moschata]|uniref:EGF-like domain-containing protein n=1 Tax=Aromia moschata TaxID=1265417 RepID=A0AAV8Z0M8_9CUCU|nr:hypothetical protein NQ318_007714 [Aromia moschata]